MRSFIASIALLCLLALPAPAQDGPVGVMQEKDGVVIENDFVRIGLASLGGAVTRMVCKQAVSLPFIEDKGARIAATGRFFTDDAAAVAFDTELVEKGPDRVVVRMKAKVDALGLAAERTLTLGRGESGFTLTRAFRNEGDAAVTLKPGAALHQQAEPWRTDLRLYMGNGPQHKWIFGPYNAGAPQTWTWKTADVQWQMLSQYGVGVVAHTAAGGPVDFSVHYPKKPGVPFDATWQAAPVIIEPGKAFTLTTRVLICEGMREVFAPLPESRVLAAAYMCTGARPGEELPAFGVAVSAERRTVTLGIERYHYPEKGSEKPVTLTTREVTLEPGKAVEFHHLLSMEDLRLGYVTCFVEQDGKRLAAGGCRAWIGSDPEKMAGEAKGALARYLRKMPELHYKGTWQEIGAKLAEEGKIKPGKTRANAAEILTLYETEFPYYADILKGAATQLKTTPEKLAAAELGDGRLFASALSTVSAGCMAFYLNGPDGPICAYSKERSGSSVRGQGYMKMLPATGYRFHMYTLGGWSFGYGVNEKGLATGGATINCDDVTDKAGKALTKAWTDKGNVVAPLGALMMLASCATVEEAVAFIDNPKAPFSFTGNMLIVDAAGNAAALQSVGIKHMIRRYAGPKDRMDPALPTFASTNYTHPNEAGEYKPGKNWAWHANALLREWRVNRFVTALGGQVALKDCFWIMRSQNQPGGVCQNGFDNVGHLNTTCSFIAHPRTRELWLTNGNPSQTHYEHYKLME